MISWNASIEAATDDRPLRISVGEVLRKFSRSLPRLNVTSPGASRSPMNPDKSSCIRVIDASGEPGIKVESSSSVMFTSLPDSSRYETVTRSAKEVLVSSSIVSRPLSSGSMNSMRTSMSSSAVPVTSTSAIPASPANPVIDPVALTHTSIFGAFPCGTRRANPWAGSPTDVSS